MNIKNLNPKRNFMSQGIRIGFDMAKKGEQTDRQTFSFYISKNKVFKIISDWNKEHPAGNTSNIILMDKKCINQSISRVLFYTTK